MKVIKRFHEWRMYYKPSHVFRGRVVEYKNNFAPYGIEVSHTFIGGGPILPGALFTDYEAALFQLAGQLHLLDPENAIVNKSYVPDADPPAKEAEVS